VVTESPKAPIASVVIVTRNRREMLRDALRTAVRQEGEVEVIVADDGSTDGTPEMVRDEFPQVRLVREEESSGYIRRRNSAARLARADVIISIDDDAEFTADDTVRRTVAFFDHPRVAAVAMPFVQERRSDEVLQRAPAAEGIWVTNAFIGTAHALRRDVFLALGGYREALEHLFEEPDYCLRALDAGFVVRLGDTEPIVHHESTTRNVARDLTHICRNHVLLAWLHVPLPFVLARAAQTLGYVARAAVLWRAPRPALRGLALGVRYVAANPRTRAPLSRRAYRLHRSLKRRPARLEAVEAELPPLSQRVTAG